MVNRYKEMRFPHKSLNFELFLKVLLFPVLIHFVQTAAKGTVDERDSIACGIVRVYGSQIFDFRTLDPTAVISVIQDNSICPSRRNFLQKHIPAAHDRDGHDTVSKQPEIFQLVLH